MGSASAVPPRVVTAPIVLRGGDELAGLIHAAMRVSSAAGGQLVITGGVAVTCRLQNAHRATSDLDTVAEERTPAVVEILCAEQGIERDRSSDHRVHVEGVKVDIISAGAIESPDDLQDLDAKQRLFVLAHRYALDSAERVHVLFKGAQTTLDVSVRLATPAALVAMKLHAIQDRREATRHKQASDGYDLYRLLADLDDDGGVAAAVAAADEPLQGSVRDAAASVLLGGATHVIRSLRTYMDGRAAAVTEDELTFVAERFVDRL